jgi:hypothetical protein
MGDETSRQARLNIHRRCKETDMKALKIILATALLMALMVVAIPVSAQEGITWTTGFQVQNLSNAQASITLTFYDSTTGNQSGTPTNDTIAASGSKTYFPIPSVAAGFNGSLVISSDQPVTAILNIIGNNFAYGGSVTGLTAGATKVGLPLILRGLGGFQTWFAVQNTGTTNASVTVTFTPRDASSGNAFTTTAVAIKPGASKTFDTAGITQLGSSFAGSATVNSTQPVAVVVNQTGLTAFKVLENYDGFAAGSPTVSVPLVQNGNGNPLTFSGLAIQNVGTSATNITVSFSANTRGTFQPTPITFPGVQPGQTKTINTANATNNASAPGFGGNDTAHRYVGSATITNSGGQNLVAVVNQLASTNGSSYEGFNPTAATAKVSAPLLMANNAGFFTGTQCQNVGNADTTITLTYGANTKGTFQPQAVQQVVKKGASGTPILQAGTAFGTNRYVGSGTVTSTGGVPIVCVVNESQSGGTGDILQTYNATNY